MPIKKKKLIIYSFLIVLPIVAVLLVLTKEIWINWFPGVTRTTQVDHKSLIHHQQVLTNDINKVESAFQNELSLLDSKDPIKEAVFEAARWGNIEQIKNFASRGMPLDAPYDYGQTPLSVAAGMGQKEVVEFLIAQNANVNNKDFNGESPLHRAAMCNYIDIVELLINNGAEIDAKDNKGETPLIEASFEGFSDVAQLLIDKGADVDNKDNTNTTALFYAAIQGFSETIQILLMAGAKADFVGADGLTPLHLTVNPLYLYLDDYQYPPKIKMIKFLITRGQYINIADRFTYPERIEIAKLLISKGADVNAEDKEGYTPLYWAVMRHEQEMAELLMSHGATG